MSSLVSRSYWSPCWHPPPFLWKAWLGKLSLQRKNVWFLKLKYEQGYLHKMGMNLFFFSIGSSGKDSWAFGVMVFEMQNAAHWRAVPCNSSSEQALSACLGCAAPAPRRLLGVSTRGRMAVSHFSVPTAAPIAQSKMTCKHPTARRKMNRMQGQAQCQQSQRGKSS